MVNIAPNPSASAKNTPMTVSCASPVRSRTTIISTPTSTPNPTIASGIIQDAAALSLFVNTTLRVPRATPANAQWAIASLKNAIRLPTTSPPTVPHSAHTTISARTPFTTKRSVPAARASHWIRSPIQTSGMSSAVR